jgi:hypothetical protein
VGRGERGARPDGPTPVGREDEGLLDNGSSHRDRAAIARLTEAYPRLVPVHLPIHASWLNQVEIYFSILERKVLTPPAAASFEELAARILAFQANYEALAAAFERKFTRADLAKLLERLAGRGRGPLAGGGMNTSPNFRAPALRIWPGPTTLRLSRGDDFFDGEQPARLRRNLNVDRLALIQPEPG